MAGGHVTDHAVSAKVAPLPPGAQCALEGAAFERPPTNTKSLISHEISRPNPGVLEGSRSWGWSEIPAKVSPKFARTSPTASMSFSAVAPSLKRPANLHRPADTTCCEQEAEFECTICCDVLLDPVVAPLCGHDFCKVCYDAWIHTNSVAGTPAACPLCRCGPLPPMLGKAHLCSANSTEILPRYPHLGRCTHNHRHPSAPFATCFSPFPAICLRLRDMVERARPSDVKRRRHDAGEPPRCAQIFRTTCTDTTAGHTAVTMALFQSERSPVFAFP